jgi:hypothetical protein
MASALGIGSTAFTVWMLANFRIFNSLTGFLADKGLGLMVHAAS